MPEQQTKFRVPLFDHNSFNYNNLNLYVFQILTQCPYNQAKQIVRCLCLENPNMKSVNILERMYSSTCI